MPNLSGEKFELRLIRTADILLHEEYENDRSSRLSKRFKAEKVLYNPLILGRYKSRYILIDGANRFEALKRLSCRIVLAQIVNYMDPEFTLKAWYHFVPGMKLADLLKFLKRKKIKYEYTGFDIKPGKISEVIERDNNFEAIRIKLSRTARQMLGQIRNLYSYYEFRYRYSRIDSDTDISDLNNVSNREGLLIIYPEFSKENILNISAINHKLPAGITRHLIPNRVLHIKYPIEKLKSHVDLDKKNSELLKFVIHKIENKKVRLYKEPILIFDEY